MRRTIRSYRTRKNVIEQSALRDQFIRDLTLEATNVLKQLSEQFSQTLQTQVAQAFQGIVPGDAPVTPTTAANEVGTISSVGQLLSTGVRYLVSRPRTSRDSQETSRSIDSTAQFRLSSGQTAAEAQQALGRGDKNL
jgi:hypothetical protein